jgi:signal transduction histidine kinase
MIFIKSPLQIVLSSLALLPGVMKGQSLPLDIEIQARNPIGQVARIFNSQLVKVEERVSLLNSRLATVAIHREQSLRYGVGYRGGRLSPQDADPSVTLDLGAEYPLENLFLIPAQRESTNDIGLLPIKFTIELSNRADFGQRMVLFTAGSTPFPSTGGKPVRFGAHNTVARYVRLTVHEGHSRGDGEIFALSEFVAISKGEPVSFGAAVSGEGILAVPGIWQPEYLTDGRTPLGVWQSGEWAGKNRGELVSCESGKETISWTLDLAQQAPLDRLILFPNLGSETVEGGVLPEAMTFRIESADAEPFTLEWHNPMPGTNQSSPLVIPLRRTMASRIQITGTTPWQMGSRRIYAMAEMEAWSDGRNLAKDRPVKRLWTGQETTISSLTDGFASERQIIPVSAWLGQLHDRWRLESELQSLKPIREEMASESELNATWGSAVMLGLTFLIPVFIVERRRLINRNHLDNLRKRIASDLHDDIGSNLGSISLIARTARKDLVRLHGPEEIADDLGEVESIARESSLAMRDIVWLLERSADSIGDLVQRMRDTANRLLRDIDYTIECESCKTASKLSLDAKRHLFLFYKEAIHNIFKHSKATRVSVRLWDVDDKLALEICDNGIGFSSASDDKSSSRPSSVHKLEERARVLDGQLDVVSVEGKGTSVRLTVKRSHLIVHSSLP